MIKEKELEPPAYDTLVSSTTNHGRAHSSSPTSSSFFQPLPTPPLSASSGSSSSGWSTWMPWSSSQKTYNELQAHIRRLIRELVVGIDPAQAGQSETPSAADAAKVMLHSSAGACAKHGVSLKSILQEKYIEEHSPLYWAIVKLSSARPVERREAEPDAADAPDILGDLLSYSLPLKPSTISELRHACLSVSDQNTFQRLRLLVPNFSTLSGADRILLGASLSSDVDVTTIGSENNNGAFAVTMQFPQFHKRLMVSREVGVEFIVRHRIWSFSFAFIENDWPDDGPRDGAWCATLCLPEDDQSPPTWFDGQLILTNPHKEQVHGREEAAESSSRSVDTVNPDETIRMRSKPDRRLESSSDRMKQIAVLLGDNPAFASLQFAMSLFLLWSSDIPVSFPLHSESSYIPAHEKLTVRLEGRLVKPS